MEVKKLITSVLMQRQVGPQTFRLQVRQAVISEATLSLWHRSRDLIDVTTTKTVAYRKG